MSPQVPGRADGADLNAVTGPDDCTQCLVTEYIMFVAYISFNKHFSKKYYNRHHIGVRLMIKQCTGFYVCYVAPTTKVSLIQFNWQ